GKAFQVEELEHRKHDEEESHEVVHPHHPIPAGVIGDLLCAGGEQREGDDDQERDVIRPLRTAPFMASLYTPLTTAWRLRTLAVFFTADEVVRVAVEFPPTSITAKKVG